MILLYSLSGNRKLCPLFFLGRGNSKFTTTSDILSIGIATAETFVDFIYIAGQVCTVPTARCRSNVRWSRCRIYVYVHDTFIHTVNRDKHFSCLHTTACQTRVELCSSSKTWSTISAYVYSKYISESVHPQRLKRHIRNLHQMSNIEHFTQKSKSFLTSWNEPKPHLLTPPCPGCHPVASTDKSLSSAWQADPEKKEVWCDGPVWPG